jgi:cyclopropane fatty-acyl-phospholipid synthase-like methyltransferase
VLILIFVDGAPSSFELPCMLNHHSNQALFISVMLDPEYFFSEVTMMDDLQLLVDLHLAGKRQGPGSDGHTVQALELAGLRGLRSLNIAEIGCGTGAAALTLAKELDAEITAVDFLPAFLRTLDQRAEAQGLADRITTLEASMDALPFADQAFDVIWSEGAIYNMGFAAGIAYWQRFLKPGGMLAVSEITWLTAERPAELEAFWQNAYAEIDTASAKFAVLESNGFTPIGYFTLPKTCWLEHYYRPMEARFETFLAKHQHSEAAKAVVAENQQEVELYEQYSDYYSYGFYIAQKG